jgi:hypothetical protein
MISPVNVGNRGRAGGGETRVLHTTFPRVVLTRRLSDPTTQRPDRFWTIITAWVRLYARDLWCKRPIVKRIFSIPTEPRARLQPFNDFNGVLKRDSAVSLKLVIAFIKQLTVQFVEPWDGTEIAIIIITVHITSVWRLTCVRPIIFKHITRHILSCTNISV